MLPRAKSEYHFVLIGNSQETLPGQREQPIYWFLENYHLFMLRCVYASGVNYSFKDLVGAEIKIVPIYLFLSVIQQNTHYSIKRKFERILIVLYFYFFVSLFDRTSCCSCCEVIMYTFHDVEYILRPEAVKTYIVIVYMIKFDKGACARTCALTDGRTDAF